MTVKGGAIARNLALVVALGRYAFLFRTAAPWSLGIRNDNQDHCNGGRSDQPREMPLGDRMGISLASYVNGSGGLRPALAY